MVTVRDSGTLDSDDWCQTRLNLGGGGKYRKARTWGSRRGQCSPLTTWFGKALCQGSRGDFDQGTRFDSKA